MLPLDYQQQCQQHMQLFKKKNHGSGTTALIILIEEIKDITKIFKSLEESELLIEGISETIKKKQKNKKADFSQCY